MIPSKLKMITVICFTRNRDILRAYPKKLLLSENIMNLKKVHCVQTNSDIFKYLIFPKDFKAKAMFN